MPADEELYHLIAKAISEQTPAVLITVIETKGSAPQCPGAKMVVTHHSQHGSIGGGAVENMAVVHGRTLLDSEKKPEIIENNLSTDLGMCCGGSMTLFFEPLVSQPSLVIYGGGHIAKPLCSLAAQAGFSVTVCDGRKEWISRDRFPEARNCVMTEGEDHLKSVVIKSSTYVVLMTHSHDLDEEIASEILKLKEMPFYLGMIGSRRKRELMRKRLAEAGLDRDRIDSIHTPMGLNIGAVSPEEIAISIAAELVALRRGREIDRSW